MGAHAATSSWLNSKTDEDLRAYMRQFRNWNGGAGLIVSPDVAAELRKRDVVEGWSEARIIPRECRKF